MAGVGKVKALQIWCKNRVLGYRNVSVENMTTSWRDGLAFCALIHKYRPDLIDFNSLSKENVYDNNALAFDIAERCLSVPALLDAEDMVRLRTPDRLSIITYVAQLHNVFKDMEPVGGPAVSVPVKIHQFANRTISSPEPKKKIISNKENKKLSVKETMESKAKVSSSLDICDICDGKVYLIEKHMVDGKMYHRSCFKQQNRKTDPTPRISQTSRPKSAFQLTTQTTPVDNRPDWQKNLQKKSDTPSNLGSFLDRKIQEEKKKPSSPVQEKITLRKQTPSSEVKKDSPKTRPVSSAVDMTDGIEKLRMLREQARSQRAGSPSLKERLQKLQSLSENHKTSNQSSVSSPLREKRKFPIRDSIPEIEQEEIIPTVQKSASDNGAKLKTHDEPSKVRGGLSSKTDSVTVEQEMVNEAVSDQTSKTVTTDESIWVEQNASNNASPMAATASNPFELDDEKDIDTTEVKPTIENLTDGKSVAEKVVNEETETSEKDLVVGAKEPSVAINSQLSAGIDVSEVKTPDESLVEEKVVEKNEDKVDLVKEPVDENLKKEEIRENRSDSVNSSASESSISLTTPQPKARTKRAASLRVQQSAQKTNVGEETTANKSMPTVVKTSPDSSRLNTTISTQKTDRSPKPPRPTTGPSVKPPSLPDKKSKRASPVQMRDKTSKPARPSTVAVPADRKTQTKTSANNAPPKPARTSMVPNSSQNEWEDSLSSWASKRKATRPQPQTTWYTTDYPKENNPFGDDEAEETTAKSSPDDYDKSLNPFADEENSTPTTKTNSASVQPDPTPKSLNPFEDEEEEPSADVQKSESQSKPIDNKLNRLDANSRASPQQKKKISFNPFESDDSDDEAIINKKPKSRKSRETNLILPHVSKKKHAPAPPKDNSLYVAPKEVYAVPIKSSSLHDVNESTPPSKPSVPDDDSSILSDELVKRKSKPAPPRPMPPQRRPVSDYGIGADEVTTELRLIELKQEELERQGRLLEESIRNADVVLANSVESVDEDDLMAKWLETINEKNRLVRREAELVFIIKHQDLETKQADIEWQLRQIMHKAENLKTDDEKTEEERLIHELVTIVTERGNLVDAMDDERMRHAEEDAEINSMMNEKHLTAETDKTTPKSNSKNKKDTKAQVKKEKTPKKKLLGQ